MPCSLRLLLNKSFLDSCCSEIWLPGFCEIFEAILCWRSLPVFDAGILMRNPSPTKPSTLICRISKPSACSSISLWLDMAGNLQLAVGKTQRKKCTKNYAWSLQDSGKHSGVGRTMQDNAGNQLFCSGMFWPCRRYCNLHLLLLPTTAGFWRMTWWFLMVSHSSWSSWH